MCEFHFRKRKSPDGIAIWVILRGPKASKRRSEAGSNLSKIGSWTRHSFCTDLGCDFEWGLIQNALNLNEHLDANFTSAVNCGLPENAGPPMRFCCFEDASISVWAKNKYPVRSANEVQTRHTHSIEAAFNKHWIWDILGFHIEHKTVQKSFWICAST